MKTVNMLEELELFVTLIDGRPAFWEIRDGYPTMMTYALTASADRENGRE